MSVTPLLQYDRLLVEKTGMVVGVDEAGRGALAGPVVAAAVALDQNFYNSIWCRQNSSQINDSKKLSAEHRESLYSQFATLKQKGAIGYCAGVASVGEIERLNILGATKLAMQRALEGLQKNWEGGFLQDSQSLPLFEQNIQTPAFSGVARVFIDGNPLKPFPYLHQSVVHGDAKSLAIAMASVIAKVTRDRIMDGLDMKLPLYGFAQNKGYATYAHRQAILEHGASTEHRPLFLRKLRAQGAPEMEFVFSSKEKIS